MKLKKQFKSPEDKERYFKAVVKNIETHDKEKQSKVNEHEFSLDEVLYDMRKKEHRYRNSNCGERFARVD